MAHDYDILDGVPAPYDRGSSPVPPNEEAQEMRDSGTGKGGGYNGSQEQGTAEELGQSSQEEHIPLTFQIPAQELKNAMQVSRSSGAAFWKHSLYRGPDGRKIKVHYCRNKEDSETVAQLFLNQDTLGFDLEWKPSYATKEKSKEKLLDSPVLTEKVIKEAVSLIQLASEDRIALFHIALHKGGTIDELVAPTLKKIMESPDISKAGVAVGGDATRLRTFLGIQCQGLFELSHLYRLVKFSEKAPRQVNKRLVSLAQQVGECLYLPLHKGDVRSSDWSKVLNWDQTVYAASDAYAGFRLFDVLEQRRKRLNPTPPRPAHLELNLPIRLAQALVDEVSDQTQIEEPASEETQGDEVAYPTLPMEGLEVDSWTSSRESAENTQEADVDAVAYPTLPVEGSEDDPLETDVEVEGTTASTTPGDSGLGEVSHAEDGGLASQIDTADTPHATNVSESESPSTNAEVSIPKPIEVQHAEAWLENWQASLPTDYTPKASKAALRAYALWHHQSLPVPRIASILRAPPLQLTTVATYILEAVRIERLPFDGPRIREPLDVLPVSVHGRYRAVLNKAQ
ncbi:hypothetical protein B0A49_01644 [Cryomyces minteri]|uniref:3'-5' exonuclease domain-containing protein n=1 Tax=Cryomyces minteri TaxID=331657 RepID=A0A4V5NHD9_9PEZI|nr:hypothetical protein B0A49_01644 [Cryomyces minteri]